MNKQIVFGISGVLLGIILTLVVQNFTPLEKKKDFVAGSNMMHEQMNHGESMNNSMNMMTSMLQGKKGAEFDKAFISEMIMHHQGAIEMANLALQNAERQEIKDLATAIISAQTSEINQMKQWQQAWFGN